MLTPQLEQWILCGKAFFKTFVAGGDKHTLNIGNDRFIIITDITYFPMNIATQRPGEEPITYQNHNTQVAIYGERGYNHYIFRNYNDARQNQLDFCGPTTINTYILHDQQVGFSFCNAPYFNNQFLGIADTYNPGYTGPIDFGIDGQPATTNVTLTMDAQGVAPIQNNFTTRPAAGSNESQQLRFPFDIANSFGNGPASGYKDKYEYPLLLVNYVEVIGSSNNIQI